MAKAAKEAGYTGIFVTNHAWGGNTSVDRALPWREWIEHFAIGYENARIWGDRNGLDVFFGYESGYQGTEFLIYGLSPWWMMEHEELHDASIEKQLGIVHEGGGIVIHAHPFREESYIPEIRLYPEFVDGVEGFNATHASHLSRAHNNPEYDAKATEYARKHKLPMVAGSDVHNTLMLGGGILTSKRLTSSQDLVQLIRSADMYLLSDGERIYDRFANPIE